MLYVLKSYLLAYLLTNRKLYVAEEESASARYLEAGDPVHRPEACYPHKFTCSKLENKYLRLAVSVTAGLLVFISL